MWVMWFVHLSLLHMQIAQEWDGRRWWSTEPTVSASQDSLTQAVIEALLRA